MKRRCSLGIACFVPRKKTSPKSKWVHESFLSQKIFCDFPVWKELENEKFERVNENENKENENVVKFQEYILGANTKVKAESDMKA